jgi:hypothetical protein
MNLGQARVGIRTQSVISANLVTSGLILHLDSGNSGSYPGTGTTWTDLSGNGRNATLINGPVYSSVDGGGKIVFDGTNDYAEFSNPPVLGSSDFTIEIWFKRKSSSLNWNNTLLLNKWNSGAISGSNEWGIGFGDAQDSSNGNNLNFGLEAQGGGFYGITSEEILINTWYQALVTREGGTLKMYINGSLRTTATPSATYTGPLVNKSINNVVGRKMRLAYHDSSYGSTYYANVEVPIIRMYNRALNVTEVAQNYLNNKSRFGMIDNPQILNNLILDINPSLYVSGSTTLINPANVGNNIKVWGNETDSTSAPVWNRRWFSFDGINDYLEVKDAKPFMFGTQSFTISTWLKQKNTNFGWSGAGFSKWNTGATPGSNNWSIGLASDYNVLKPSFTIDSSGTFYSVSSSDNISANNWHHVVGVRDGGTLKVYVNGILKGTNSPSGFSTRSVSNFSQPLYLGKTGAGYNQFMDSGRVQIYNKALSESEILSLYNTQKTDFIISSGLQLYIDASLASSYTSGTGVNDISGNGRVATLGGVGFTASNNGAFTFTGNTSAYISTNYTQNVPAGSSFTIGVWVNGQSFSPSNASVVASNYNGTPTAWNLYINGSGKFMASTRDDSNTITKFLTSTTTVSNSWKYLVYRKNGNVFSLFVNGVQEDTQTITLGPITVNNTMRFGNYIYNDQPLVGKIGETHVYNVALSDADIQHNFTSTRSRYGV